MLHWPFPPQHLYQIQRTESISSALSRCLSATPKNRQKPHIRAASSAKFAVPGVEQQWNSSGTADL